MSGALKYGDAAAREVSERFGGAFATEAALQALGPAYRADGMVVVAGGKVFQFDDDSTASDGLSPSSGSGKWLVRGEASALIRVRVATAAALPANTRTSNTLTADANAALNDTGIDGLTDLAVGELVLVKNESTGANNGLYVLTGIGAADAKWSMVRASTHSQSDQMRAGVLITVNEGTANGNTLFMLTTDDAIVLNTTALTFSAIATTTTGTALQTLLASTSNGEGASLVGIEDSGTLITGTTVEAALAENRALINTNTAAIFQKRTLNVTQADLTESSDGVAQALNIGAALPANAVVVASEVDITTLFSGGGATAVTIDVGGTDADAIGDGHDVFTGAATGKLAFSTAGVHPVGSFSSEQLTITFTPDGSHDLADLDAGELDVTVWFHVLA
jgi:hypothetical protein